jgi:peptidylprolyl isomerase
MRRALPLLALCAALAGLAAGCGKDKTNGSTQASTPATAPAATAPPAATTQAPQPTQAASKPKVKVPSGPPPKKLVVKDLRNGSGQPAKPGDTLTVQYVGVLYANGKQFDASWDRPGQPFSFQLGAGGVIPGWDQGLVGLKPGGRRELIIPPALGYGSQGTPDGTIPPNAPLIFVIDLQRIG